MGVIRYFTWVYNGYDEGVKVPFSFSGHRRDGRTFFYAFGFAVTLRFKSSLSENISLGKSDIIFERVAHAF